MSEPLTPQGLIEMIERHVDREISLHLSRFEVRISQIERKIETAREETVLIRVLRRLIAEELKAKP